MKRLDRLVKQLQQFGFSEKEARLYLCLSELGPSTIQDIAKYSKISRSTTHILCEQLKKKGFIGETHKGKKRLLFIEDLSRFRDVIDGEKFQLNMKEMALGNLIANLHNLHPTHNDTPKVRFYEGAEGFIKICERSLQKAKGTMYFVSSMPDYYRVTTQQYGQDYYVPTRVEKKIKIRILAPKDEYTEKLKQNDVKELRQTKFLPPTHPFKSTMFIYGDEFSLISSHAPFLGVVVESKELAHFMTQLFHIMWDSTEY